MFLILAGVLKQKSSIAKLHFRDMFLKQLSVQNHENSLFLFFLQPLRNIKILMFLMVHFRGCELIFEQKPLDVRKSARSHPRPKNVATEAFSTAFFFAHVLENIKIWAPNGRETIVNITYSEGPKKKSIFCGTCAKNEPRRFRGLTWLTGQIGTSVYGRAGELPGRAAQAGATSGAAAQGQLLREAAQGSRDKSIPKRIL